MVLTPYPPRLRFARFHFKCVKLRPEQAEEISAYFCPNCEAAGLGTTQCKSGQGRDRCRFVQHHPSQSPLLHRSDRFVTPPIVHPARHGRQIIGNPPSQARFSLSLTCTSPKRAVMHLAHTRARAGEAQSPTGHVQTPLARFMRSGLGYDPGVARLGCPGSLLLLRACQRMLCCCCCFASSLGVPPTTGC